ncbi:MAG: PEP-CTERM sorting domain-containing protein [Phycisphaerales bacterium]|jgi:hypothetical protein|nr:PEP-CTERM sorting domain-containing protein [Phycisphaerales bacterium]
MAAVGLGVSATTGNAATVLNWNFETGAPTSKDVPWAGGTVPGWAVEQDASPNDFDGLLQSAYPSANSIYNSGGAYSGSNYSYGLTSVFQDGYDISQDFIRQTTRDMTNPAGGPYTVEPKFANLIPGTNSFTWQIFIKAPQALQFQQTGYIAHMVGSNNTESDIGIQMGGAGTADAGKLLFNVTAQDTPSDNGVFKLNNFKTAGTYNDDQWHHLAIVRDAVAETVTYYVDYQQVYSHTDYSGWDASANGGLGAPMPGVSNISAFSPVAQSSGIVLGGGWPVDARFGVTLGIDDFQIDDVALSANQFNGAPVPEPASIGLLMGGATLLVMRRRRSS